MPKTKRDVLKTQLNYAATNLDRAIDYIALVGQQFIDPHPELGEGFVIATQLLMQAAEVIDTIYISAWDHLPPNWKHALNSHPDYEPDTEE